MQGRILAAALICLFAGCASADFSQHPKTPELLQSLRQDYGFTDPDIAVVVEALKAARLLPNLIKAEVTNKEVTLLPNWDKYRPLHVNARNIANGTRFLADNRQWFAKAEAEFGVPPAVIAGILGVETKYGTYTGRFRVLDALATQGFDHPTRAPFFFSELKQFFVFCRDSSGRAEDYLGSYAGAMGDAQFMPSNYRSLALDYDGDGRRDLWTAPDAIGSIANYLTHYDPSRAFRRGEPLVLRATLTKELPDEFPRNGRIADQTIASLRTAGVVTSTRLPNEMPAGLVELRRGAVHEFWIALPNFYAVQTYNPRIFYAMAVTQLANALAEAQTAATRTADAQGAHAALGAAR